MIPFIDFDNDFLDTEALLFLSGASGGTGVEATATGNPLVFTTDLARPLKSLLIPFTPKQSGTGDPSPQNIRSILPLDGLTVFGGGKNLVDCTIGETKSNNGIDYVVLSDGGVNCEGIANGSSYGIESNSTTLPSGMYTFSVTGATNAKTVIVKNNAYYREINGDGSTTFTLTEETVIRFYIMFSNGAVANETVYVQLEVGQTATSYEPYHPITETDIVFPSPVYGGTLDVVSGMLTVTHIGVSEQWGEFSSDGTIDDYTHKTYDFTPIVKSAGGGGASAGSWFCNIMKYAWSGNPSLSGSHYYINESGKAQMFLPTETAQDQIVTVVAELKTPQEIQLTPAQINAIIGNNTIWSDADGSMTAVYLKKP